MKVHSKKIDGQPMRYWADPDMGGIHITLLWKSPPTLRRTAAGLLAAQRLLDQLMNASGNPLLEFTLDLARQISRIDDERSDLTLSVRINESEADEKEPASEVLGGVDE